MLRGGVTRREVSGQLSFNVIELSLYKKMPGIEMRRKLREPFGKPPSAFSRSK